MIEAIVIGIVIFVAVVILALSITAIVKDRGGKEKEKKPAKEEVKKEEAKPEVVEEEAKEEKKPMKYVLAQGEGVVVGSEGNIPCGEYTVESADGSEDFKMRIGRYVKTLKSGETVVLANNQKVTPLSASVVLR